MEMRRKKKGTSFWELLIPNIVSTDQGMETITTMNSLVEWSNKSTSASNISGTDQIKIRRYL